LQAQAADESDAQRLASNAAGGVWRKIKKEKGREKKKARQSRAVRYVIA
jgi:hypothetical protein